MSNKEKFKYETGERILCFHGPLLYEAKCLDRKEEKNECLYYIHYRGWSKAWDEWVNDTRMFKYDKAGLEKQAQLEKTIKNIRRTKTKKSVKGTQENTKSELSTDSVKDNSKTFAQPKSPEKPDTKDNVKSAGSVKSNKNSRVPPSVLKENIFSNSLTVEFPDNLKAWLVDDWDLITRQSYLVTLPTKKTVKDMLSDYLASISIKQEDKTSEEDIRNVEIIIECVSGLKLYFDSILGSHLLYKFERLQYGELYKRSPDKNVSYIYGTIHFLRLIVKMRDLTNCMKLPTSSNKVLSDCLNRILIFISEREKTYISLEDYAVAPAEYQRRAMC